MANRSPEPLSRHDQAIDEAEAIKSLDDTTIRPLPDEGSPWTTTQFDRLPTTDHAWGSRRDAPGPTLSKAQLGALVGAVALVSFVAGGVTARLGSQVPLLVAQQSSTHEAKLTLDEEVVPVTETHETTAAEPEPFVDDEPAESAPTTSTPPAYDTGYDDTQEPDASEDDTSRWTWDDRNGNSISYDNSNRVTVDYDGYSLTFDLDSLTGTEGNGGDDNRAYPLVTTDEPRSVSPYDLDPGTGYDHEEERDSYFWHHHSSTGAVVSS